MLIIVLKSDVQSRRQYQILTKLHRYVLHTAAYNLVKIGKNFNRIIKITYGKKTKQSFGKKN